MTTPIITHPAPSVQTCPTCSGQGSIVRGPYSHGCADCHGEGIRTESLVRCITCWAMVPESHIADAEAQFCRDCAMAADEPVTSYIPTTEDLRWATERAEAQRVADPVIAGYRARQVAAAMVRRPWVEAIR